MHQDQEHVHGRQDEHQTVADRLAAFLDEYWPALLITFGAFFIFIIPFHTGDSYFGKILGHDKPSVIEH